MLSHNFDSEDDDDSTGSDTHADKDAANTPHMTHITHAIAWHRIAYRRVGFGGGGARADDGQLRLEMARNAHHAGEEGKRGGGSWRIMEDHGARVYPVCRRLKVMLSK